MTINNGVDLLKAWPRLDRSLVRSSARLGRRINARASDSTLDASTITPSHYVEVSEQRVVAAFDQMDI